MKDTSIAYRGGFYGLLARAMRLGTDQFAAIFLAAILTVGHVVRLGLDDGHVGRAARAVLRRVVGHALGPHRRRLQTGARKSTHRVSTVLY